MPRTNPTEFGFVSLGRREQHSRLRGFAHRMRPVPSRSLLVQREGVILPPSPLPSNPFLSRPSAAVLDENLPPVGYTVGIPELRFERGRGVCIARLEGEDPNNHVRRAARHPRTLDDRPHRWDRFQTQSSHKSRRDMLLYLSGRSSSTRVDTSTRIYGENRFIDSASWVSGGLK